MPPDSPFLDERIIADALTDAELVKVGSILGII